MRVRCDVARTLSPLERAPDRIEHVLEGTSPGPRVSARITAGLPELLPLSGRRDAARSARPSRARSSSIARRLADRPRVRRAGPRGDRARGHGDAWRQCRPARRARADTRSAHRHRRGVADPIRGRTEASLHAQARMIPIPRGSRRRGDARRERGAWRAPCFRRAAAGGVPPAPACDEPLTETSA